jgi:ribosome-associated protein
MPADANVLVVNSQIRIPHCEFEFRFARSSGPGGQNVNKVASKAQMRWRPAASAGLPADVRDRFLARHAGKLTVEGELVIASQRYRDQARNVADCLEKLRSLLLAVAAPPKKRRKTQPTRASRERRLEEKRAVAKKKTDRRAPRSD